MSKPPSFELVLDTCLSDVTSGRRSPEQCLEEWPQYRERLGPMLETALAVRELRGPALATHPVRRAQFMRELRTTPQGRKRAPFALRAFGSFVRTATAVAGTAAIVIAVILLMQSGGGGSSVQASTLTVFSGGVQRAIEGEWAPLQDSDRLSEGDRLRTDGEGRAVLTFADGTTVTLEPATEIALARVRTESTRQIEVEQTAGRLWNSVAPVGREDASYVVRTPDATVTAHGTVFETAIVDGKTSVSTAEGVVEMATGDARVLVEPGETANTAASAQPSTPQQPAPTPQPPQKVRLDILVQAPFVASLIGPTGLATGALPEGIVYQQMPGIVSSDPGKGAQHITFTKVPPEGTYTLVLRRIDDGEGELVIDATGAGRRIHVDAATEMLVAHLRPVVVAGQLSLLVEDVQTERDIPEVGQLERLIVTEQAKERATEVAKQRAHWDDEDEHEGDDDRTPTLTRTPQPTTPTAVPTSQGPGAKSTPDADDTQRPVDRGPRNRQNERDD